MKRPLIGITLDRDDTSGIAHEAVYELRENYFSAIWQAGGLAIGLPHQEDYIPDLLDRLDGVIISGGMFDIDPALYGDVPRDNLTLKPKRTRFELAIAREALKRDMPILGICGGLQILGVVAGARLNQDIGKDVPGSVDHMHDHAPDRSAHKVFITPHSRLANLLSREMLEVNSLHHQSLRELSDDITVSARAEDGVIEAIELQKHRFAIGLQWHPEYLVGSEHAIFEGLVSAARLILPH